MLLNQKTMTGNLAILLLLALVTFQCTSKTPENKTVEDSRMPIIFDTDANNELDDQHALAYLLFNSDLFNVKGITVNATYNGGEIQDHFDEAERVLRLTDYFGKVPLYAGANSDFEDIRSTLPSDNYDGYEAVEYIIEEAKKAIDKPLVLLPVGKLTNIALALHKAPEIKHNIRIVWLGSNYPEPGEYNLENDIPSMNYILDLDVPFEMVMVRYGKPSGSDAVKVTPEIISQKMVGLGPEVFPVEGRHGSFFTTFGDYSESLFENIDLYGDPPGRALFDMVAVAILKNETWGKKKSIPAPIMNDEKWVSRPENNREVIIWEDFDKELILNDFFETIENPFLIKD